MDEDLFIKTRDHTEQRLQDLQEQTDKQRNHSFTLENFMEKYVPMRIQSQISETLNSCLDRKGMKFLALYEKQKFEDLHNMILEDEGHPGLV